MVKSVQIALFMANPPLAKDVAAACMTNQVRSFSSQPDSSVAELEGEKPRRVVSTISQGRIDFYWELAPNAISPLPEGELDLKTLKAESEGICAFANAHPVNRVAWIATSRRLASSVDEAIGWVSDQLPGIEVPFGATELTYRANVPTTIGESAFNRIAIWQAVPALWFEFKGTSVTQLTHQYFETQVDVNSVIDQDLSSGRAGAALRAAQDEGARLIVEGFSAL